MNFTPMSPVGSTRLPAALERRVARKTEWARWLLGRQDWDVFAVYFGESDTASHYLWAHHDAGSPRRPASVSVEQQRGLLHVYKALDRAVGSLLEAAGGDETESDFAERPRVREARRTRFSISIIS